MYMCVHTYVFTNIILYTYALMFVGYLHCDMEASVWIIGFFTCYRRNTIFMIHLMRRVCIVACIRETPRTRNL